jgi:hypothetical protein
MDTSRFDYSCRHGTCDMGEIIALRQMSDGEYDAARADIGNRKDAKPKWDQELCKLFTASGWATEALARREGIHVRTSSSDCYLVDFWQLLINEPWLVARQPSRA